MSAAKDYNHLAENSKPDEIREATNNRPPNISMHKLVNEWSLFKSGDDLRNFRMELDAETSALRLVPDLRLCDVKLRGAPD